MDDGFRRRRVGWRRPDELRQLVGYFGDEGYRDLGLLGGRLIGLADEEQRHSDQRQSETYREQQPAPSARLPRSVNRVFVVVANATGIRLHPAPEASAACTLTRP